MRLLFAHDHRFHRSPDGLVYSIGSFPAEVWQRYLRHFESVTVVARDGGPPPAGAQLAISTCPNVDFLLGPGVNSLSGVLHMPGEASRRLEEAVERADAVVSRLPSEIGLKALSYARRHRKPYVVEVVGCAWDAYVNHGAPLARLYAPIVFGRMRRAVREAPLVLYVTSSWLQGRYPTGGSRSCASNVELVPLDEGGLKRRQARLDELAHGQPPKLGTVASLRIKSKGIQTAIAAIARLRTGGLDLRYSVLGSGDPGPWIDLAERSGVGDLISFDGTREAGAGVRGWLDSIDVHLQPSFQEGLPRATIEAMSRGIACIGSTCGGIPELLSPDRTHRPGDVSGLAECIRRLVSNPKHLAETSRIDLESSSLYRPEALQARRDALYSRLRSIAERARERA